MGTLCWCGEILLRDRGPYRGEVSHFPWGSILLGWGLSLEEGFDLVTGLQNQSP